MPQGETSAKGWGLGGYRLGVLGIVWSRKLLWPTPSTHSSEFNKDATTVGKTAFETRAQELQPDSHTTATMADTLTCSSVTMGDILTLLLS